MRGVIERIAGERQTVEIRQGGQRLLRDRIHRDKSDRVSNHRAVGIIGQLHFQRRAFTGEDPKALPCPPAEGRTVRCQSLIDPDRLCNLHERAGCVELLEDDGEAGVARVRVVAGPGHEHVVRAGREVGEFPRGLRRRVVSVAGVEAVVAAEGRGCGIEIPLPAGRRAGE